MTEVFARRCPRHTAPPILDGLPRLERDQRLVVGGDIVQAPFRIVDAAGIDGACKQFGDALGMHAAVPILGPFRLILEKALHLGLSLEPAAGIGLKRLLDDRCQGLVAYQQLAVARNAFVTVADRWIEHPITASRTRLHLLDHLAAVLLTLELALRGEDRFDELAFRRVIEAEVQALDARAAPLERAPQLDMELGITRKPLQVVKDDDVVFLLPLCIEIAEQGHHAGPFHEVAAARYIVRKDRLDLIPGSLGILPATHLLGIQAVPFTNLLRARYAAIDESSCWD